MPPNAFALYQETALTPSEQWRGEICRRTVDRFRLARPRKRIWYFANGLLAAFRRHFQRKLLCHGPHFRWGEGAVERATIIQVAAFLRARRRAGLLVAAWRTDAAAPAVLLNSNASGVVVVVGHHGGALCANARRNYRTTKSNGSRWAKWPYAGLNRPLLWSSATAGRSAQRACRCCAFNWIATGRSASTSGRWRGRNARRALSNM